MRTRAAARALVCAALCLTTATACGGTTSSGSAGSSASTADSGSVSSSPSTSSPTATPTTASPTAPTSSAPVTPSPSATPGTSPTSGGAPGLAGRLLSAGEMPGFNDDYLWTAGRTAPESPSSSFGTCQRFSTTSIGAERALVRRFRSAAGAAAPGDSAGELVAEFPDAQTARRAFAVLKAWRARCADRLKGHTRPRVGALQDVPVTGGSGGWYLLTYGPVPGDPDAQFFDAQGMAVVGSRITMVSMVLAGQDYDYEPGREPAAVAVQRAAGKLS
jgi:hypothetical protein